MQKLSHDMLQPFRRGSCTLASRVQNMVWCGIDSGLRSYTTILSKPPAKCRSHRRTHNAVGRRPGATSGHPTYIYTDGSCLRNGTPFARAGIGVYFGRNDPSNISERIAETHSSAAELRAVQCALDYAQDDLWRGTGNPSCGPQRTHAADSANARWVIVTDCEYVVEYLTRICHTLESKGWTKNIRNNDLMRSVYSQYKATPNVKLQKVKAHTNRMDMHSVGNRAAHELAAAAARDG